jgi:FMN phosphatase YigB (HAD superfamily)
MSDVDAPTPPPPDVQLDVLLDVDGVLYPLPELFTPYAAERLGRQLELDTESWEFYTAWGLGYDDFVELLGEGVRERRLWWRGAPYDDVLPAIERLRAAGHRLHLVTARDVHGIEQEAMDATVHWLDRHGIEVESVTLAQHKPAVLRQLDVDVRTCVIVDDGPHHVAAFAEVGVYGVVLDRWGSYRGDHPTFADLIEVATHLGA